MKMYITSNFYRHFGVMFTKLTKALEGDVWVQYDMQMFLWSKCITINYNKYLHIMTLEQKNRLKSLINKPRMVQ